VILSSQRAYRELTPGLSHRLLRVTDRLVHGTVVNSAMLRDHLMRSDGIAESRLKLCYNSVDLEHFSPGTERADVLKNCWPVIGSTAVLRPEKGVATLFDAFAAIARKYTSVGLLLVGGGPQQAELEARAAALGLSDRCYFAGPVTDVLPWVRRMDVFVLPSLSEALSNSLLEAMAVGCACVASNTGGNPELVIDGETGRLFEPGNTTDLVRALEPLVEDAGLCAHLRTGAARHVASTFSRASALSVLGSFYSEQLRAKGVLSN
jgi:glycosyltransferase involved in cell wall biosynthesis